MGNSAEKLNKASKENLKMLKIQILSKTAQVIVKPFKPRTNITKMFLFPQLYYGQRISDFEKIDIFGPTVDFWPCVQGP